jgi:hypothetical protein
MTFAFALMFAGLLALVAASRNRSVSEVLQGVTDPLPGPGDTGFASRLIGGAASAAKGVASGLTAGPGVTTFEGSQVCGWIAAELRKARKNGWKGSINSGYRSEADQARVCSTGVQPCAAPGESNHQGKAYPGCAVDVSDPEGLAAALPPGSPLKWTGRSIGDDVHFSSGKRGV